MALLLKSYCSRLKEKKKFFLLMKLFSLNGALLRSALTIVSLTKDSQAWTPLFPIWWTAESLSAFLPELRLECSDLCCYCKETDIVEWIVMGAANLLYSLYFTCFIAYFSGIN